MNAAYLTPAITLFHEDGSLDFESQEHLFNNLIENGVDGILVEGSSSEFLPCPWTSAGRWPSLPLRR
ncbi:MAG: dihydrodipicolinate synthase family protein [Butyricicoccaceae bacterium]